jgi:DNA-binding transcriptional LysR family regulator
MVNSSYDMSILARVVDRGSFAAAAVDFGLSPSAVSKLVTRLESRLGVRLLNRTTRRLALTAEGEVFLDRSRKILDAIEAAESEIASSRRAAQGRLRVHAFPTFAVDHLSAVLPDFLARYPRITFEFLVTNRVIDLVDDDIDVALRVGPLGESTFVARKIADLTQVVCASPAYLARHGTPTHPRDLAQHACLTLSHIPNSRRWSFDVRGEAMQDRGQWPRYRGQRAHAAQACDKWRRHRPVWRHHRGSSDPGRTAHSRVGEFATTGKLPALGDLSAWPATCAAG